MPVLCDKCGKQAFWGKSGKRIHCKDHSTPDETYTNAPKCWIEGCIVLPTLGITNGKAISCLMHSTPEMKNVTTRKCDKCGIKQPSFNYEKLPPKYCFDCKIVGMENTKISKTKENNINKISLISNKRKNEEIY